MADRRTVRRTHRRTLNPQQLQQAVDLRHQRLYLRYIARLMAAPFSIVARALITLGLGRLRNLEPKPPVQRYEWERPGNLLHIEVKTLGRFRKVGHRITDDRQKGRSYGDGYYKVHVAIDDATQLAYVEVMGDVQKPTVIGFLTRALAWFIGQGIQCRRVMSDNGPTYVSNALLRLTGPWGCAISEPSPTRPAPTASRDIYPDPVSGMGLIHALPELGGAEPLAAALHGDL